MLPTSRSSLIVSSCGTRLRRIIIARLVRVIHEELRSRDPRSRRSGRVALIRRLTWPEETEHPREEQDRQAQRDQEKLHLTGHISPQRKVRPRVEKKGRQGPELHS